MSGPSYFETVGFQRDFNRVMAVAARIADALERIATQMEPKSKFQGALWKGKPVRDLSPEEVEEMATFLATSPIMPKPEHNRSERRP